MAASANSTITEYRSDITSSQYRTDYEISYDTFLEHEDYPAVEDHLNNLQDLITRAYKNRLFGSLADESAWNEAPDRGNEHSMCFDDLDSKLHYHLYDNDISRQALINEALNSSHFRIAQQSEEFDFDAELSTEDLDDPFDDEYHATKDKLKREVHNCKQVRYVCCVHEHGKRMCYLRRRCAHSEVTDTDINCSGNIMTSSQIAYGHHMCRNLLSYVQNKDLWKQQLLLMTSVRKAITLRTSDVLSLANLCSLKMHVLPQNPMKTGGGSDPDIRLSFNNSLTSSIADLYRESQTREQPLGFMDLAQTDTTDLQDTLSRARRLGEHLRPPKKKVKWSLRHYLVMATLSLLLLSIIIPTGEAKQLPFTKGNAKIHNDVAFAKQGPAYINAFAPIYATKTFDMEVLIDKLSTLHLLATHVSNICKQYQLFAGITDESVVYLGIMDQHKARKACNRIGKMMVMPTDPVKYNKIMHELRKRLADSDPDQKVPITAPVFFNKNQLFASRHNMDHSLHYQATPPIPHVPGCGDRLKLITKDNPWIQGRSWIYREDRPTYYHSHDTLCVAPHNQKGHIFCSISHFKQWQTTMQTAYVTCKSKAETIATKWQEIKKIVYNHMTDFDVDKLLHDEMNTREKLLESTELSAVLGKIWNRLHVTGSSSADSDTGQVLSERGSPITEDIMSYIPPSTDHHLLEGT